MGLFEKLTLKGDKIKKLKLFKFSLNELNVSIKFKL